MNKNLFRHGLVMAAVAIWGAFGLMACSDNNDNPIVDPDDGESEVVEFNPVVLYDAVAYVAPGVDADLRTALGYGIRELSAEATLNKYVFIVNKLTDIDEAVLREIFERGKTVAVAYPVKAEIDAYAESHDWLNIDTEEVGDALLLYAFNNTRHYATIELPEESGDPVAANMNRAKRYYVHLSSWLTEMSKLYLQMADPGDSNSIESFGGSFHWSATRGFSVENFNYMTMPSSDPDYLSGSGSITVSYDVYTVHVYEGQPGQGDYYAVRLTASIANANMWKGRGYGPKHGLSKSRYCGFYCNYFQTESRLCKTANRDDLADVIFPASCTPSPATTQSTTSYTDSQNFSLELSESVGTDGKGQVGAKQGWSWGHTEKRDISDINIANQTNGNIAQWQLQFQNLPYYSYSEDYGFKIPEGVTYNGTSELHASWLWYDKNGKDNENKAAYWLYYIVRAAYQIGAWSPWNDAVVKTWNTNIMIGGHTLPNVVNVTSGTLVLKNNLKDEAAISNVVVKNAKSGEVYSEFQNTIPNGGEQELGRFKTSNTYLVSFKARVPGGEAKTYTYTLNPQITLTHLNTTTLYALNDFTAQ